MKYIAILLIVLGLAACDDAAQSSRTTQAQSSGTDQATRQARGMMRLVAASPAFQRFPQGCMLNAYQTKPNVSGPVANCFKNPRQCMTQCEAGNRKACFDAAQVLEKGNPANKNRATYRLYMEGCARGDGNACVNAGATVKNTVWPEGKPQAAASASCQFRTYKKMCDEKHKWGCYMTAGEYRRTDGYRPKSKKLADKYSALGRKYAKR